MKKKRQRVFHLRRGWFNNAPGKAAHYHPLSIIIGVQNKPMLKATRASSKFNANSDIRRLSATYIHRQVAGCDTTARGRPTNNPDCPICVIKELDRKQSLVS
jgi:hypothetical protein